MVLTLSEIVVPDSLVVFPLSSEPLHVSRTKPPRVSRIVVLLAFSVVLIVVPAG